MATAEPTNGGSTGYVATSVEPEVVLGLTTGLGVLVGPFTLRGALSLLTTVTALDVRPVLGFGVGVRRPESGS